MALLPVLVCSQLSAKAILNNNYGSMTEITFQAYDENVPAYSIPENLKSTEEVLMYEVLHAVWINNKWVAYTLNKNLLGTYKVGSPSLMENNGAKRIFFVANFPGTRGGTDIYSADYKSGAWSKPKNMGDVVNTIYNEANPGLLDEKTLTFSSNGIIKKFDLNSSALEELSSAPKPAETTKPSVTTITQPVESIDQETTKPASEVTEVKPVEQPQPEQTTPIAPAATTAPSGFTSLGKKATDAMKMTYKNSIQLGVFGNPNWSQLEQFSRFGKLVTFKNEKDLNPVWVTGFKTLTEAETILQEIRTVPGFEKAYVLK
jgi:hypothetical protein